MIPEHRQLVEQLTVDGYLPAQWRSAFERVPRHLFLPDAVWAGTTELRAVVRQADPAAWLATAYGDFPVVTQMDDGAATPGGAPGAFSSSAISQPSIVAIMLDLAMIEDGMRVLEIGTGSGWNAGLLAARLGDDNVVTVEVDQQLAARARSALAAAGFQPTVVTGDGARGWPKGAPYDRVLATCSVASVPYAWIEQTGPGGYVFTPWHTAMFNGVLLRLLVAPDGTASGRFVSTAVFMALRAQRPPSPAPAAADASGEAAASTTALHPATVLDGDNAQFAVSLRVTDCYCWWSRVDDLVVARLEDPATGSWAVVAAISDPTGRFRVEQGGPRRLWDEIESGYDWWRSQGSPDYDRFGVTVGPGGQSRWLDDPERLI